VPTISTDDGTGSGQRGSPYSALPNKLVRAGILPHYSYLPAGLIPQAR